MLELVRFAAHPSTDARLTNVRAHAAARALEPHVFAIHDLPRVPMAPGDPDAGPRLLAWGARALELFKGDGHRRERSGA